MENKNNNIFLGKIEKSGCFVNNGKYGYFITTAHDKKNYKLPEWLNPDEVTLDMAKRLIAYKQKISEEWLEKKNKENKNDQSDNETSEEPLVKRLTKFIKD
jgi:topoisomerase IA-like protein